MDRMTAEQRDLAERHIYLADGLALKHARRSECDDDEARGVARLALAEAGRRFDPSRGVAFYSYAWLRIRGALVDHQRRPYSRPVTVPIDKPALSIADTAPSTESMVVDADIWSAVDRLPHRQATAIRLRYQHGYRGREIASVLGVREARVSQLIRQGCDSLRAVAA